MPGAMLRFPSGPARDPRPEKSELVFNYRPKPVLSHFTRQEAEALLQTARRVYDGSGILVDFMDAHRRAAADAGVETIAIELGAERRNLVGVIDSLEEAVQKESPTELSHDGLAFVRRLEKLLSEASSNIQRFTGGNLGSPVPRLPVHQNLGQAAPAAPPDYMIPAMVFGIVTIALVGFFIFRPQK